MEGVTLKPHAAFSKIAENHFEWKAHGKASGSPPGPESEIENRLSMREIT